MKQLLLGLGAIAAAVMAPAAASAQVPVVLVCQDGTTQPGPSEAACKSHGSVDWNTTNAWTKMRAGQYAASDTLVCTDGQSAAASATACDGHGGVDSVSTLAAVKHRAQGARYARPDTGKAGDTTHGYQPGAAGVDTAGRTDTAGMAKDSAAAKDTSQSP